ncbi:VanZ family protein [Flavicella sp.]|nr:VanZ family protein [Flavicella sp.]|tara:strand:- start:6137 stop:6529 length:393 start_codon:yes stop_codon:yes gene_type:complete
MDTKHSSKIKYFISALAVTALIAYLSLVNLRIPKVSFLSFSGMDKLEHIAAYFVLTYSWLLAVENKSSPSKLRNWVVLFVFLFGLLLEILQAFLTEYRIGEVFDLLANSMGIVFAFLFFDKLKPFFRKWF